MQWSFPVQQRRLLYEGYAARVARLAPCASGPLGYSSLYKSNGAKQGIRTYLKEELRLVLPNDNYVRIRETTAKYTVTLASDTLVYVVTNENNMRLYERAKGIALTLPSTTCAASKSSCVIPIQTVVLI
eukprot:6194188-Pleurochrysis_carterae.AAC.4